MKRLFVTVAALGGVASLGFGIAGARADFSDTCYDESSDIGTPGPVGVGYDPHRDPGVDVQNVCYRVYNPLNGTKITGGVVKTYQYDSAAPTWQWGGVQCLGDASAATTVPFCYVGYGAGVGVTSTSATAGGYVDGTAGTVESYNNGIHGIAVPTLTDTADERRVTVTAPSVCVATSRPTSAGGCFGGASGVGATVGTAKNDIGLRPNPSLAGAPTGVETNRSATPFVSANVAGIPAGTDLPGSCVGIC